MKRIGFLAAFLLVASSVQADLKLDGDTTAEATARGPAGLSIIAKSSNVSVDDTGPDISFTIPIDSFKTGISLRDEHMRKAVESDKFSDVKLVIHDADIKLPGIDDTNSVDTYGDLTFHGVTKRIPVHYESVGDCESHIGAKVKFWIDVRDFSVVPPSYLGISVKPRVDVVAQVRLTNNP